jgi:hypothetical protein
MYVCMYKVPWRLEIFNSVLSHLFSVQASRDTLSQFSPPQLIPPLSRAVVLLLVGMARNEE